MFLSLCSRDDSRPRWIIGREFEEHPIAGNQTYDPYSRRLCYVREHVPAITQTDTKQVVGHGLDDRSTDLALCHVLVGHTIIAQVNHPRHAVESRPANLN